MTDKQQQLLAAIKDQSPGNVKVALAAGADPNAYADDRSMLSWHESKAGLLLEYEQPTWLDILEALLVAGANPNLSTDQRFEEFLLHSLSQGSILTAMRLVLDHGADPNLLCEGDTALNWLDSDYCYEETCNLPAWYKGRVLPEYEATPDDLDDYETAAIWLVARHQRGWAMLRQAGGLCSWELTQGPVSEILALTPDRLGGLYTRHARPDASFLVSLGRALNERIARWTCDYLNPSLLGYDAHAVRRFDYAAHLREGMAIGEAVAPFLPEGTELEIALPTAESVAAQSTRIDVHTWNTKSRAWAKTADWRDSLSPDWFGPGPAGKLRQLHRR